MSPRRTGTSSFAPQSVIIEFHEYGGRWFVTDKWRSGSGSEVKQTVRNSALGKTILDRVNAARSEWRGALTPADEAELWERFCTEQVGTPVDQYEPDKRLIILAGQAGMRCHDSRQSPPAWDSLPATSPRKLGKALIKRITELTPEPDSASAG
jgi:hypothetical protein